MISKVMDIRQVDEVTRRRAEKEAQLSEVVGSIVDG